MDSAPATTTATLADDGGRHSAIGQVIGQLGERGEFCDQRKPAADQSEIESGDGGAGQHPPEQGSAFW